MNSVSDNKDLFSIRNFTGLTDTTSYEKEFNFSNSNINGMMHFLR